MVHPSQTTVTRLLAELHDGNRAALAELFPMVYEELRELAHRQRQRWRGDYTLDTTALLHEAYLKLVDQSRLNAGSRAHFLAIAAKAMRHILCNYARDRGRKKRGGDLRRVTLEELNALPDPLTSSEEQGAVLVALDDALKRLEDMDKGLSDVVECRFFGAMSIEDAAAALGLSTATVKRRWTLARSWLYRELQDRRGP